MEHPITERAVFVYGTLMRGQRAHHMLSGARYAGKFSLKDYAMYHLGRYPGIVSCPGETVWGELYYVSPAMLEKMDEYEEEGSLYSRVTVRLQGENGSCTAQAYVYKKDVTGYPILRRPWGTQDNER